MKKLISLLLVTTLALSLTACGGGMSKEEMLKTAEAMDPVFLQEIVDGAAENEARLIKEYEGKVVKETGVVVSDIDSNGNVTLGLSTVTTHFNLPAEDIEQFEVGDAISVVGIISEITVYSEDDIEIELQPVYFLENEGPTIFKGRF